MSAYSDYKDYTGDKSVCSGLWCESIPSNWTAIPLSYFISLESGDFISGEKISDDAHYEVFGGNGLRGYTNKYNNTGLQVLVGRQGALCGNINFANGKFWATEHALVAHPIRKIDKKWLGELLRAMDLNQYNVSAAQPGLSVSNIEKLKAPFPPYEEQKNSPIPRPRNRQNRHPYFKSKETDRAAKRETTGRHQPCRDQRIKSRCKDEGFGG